MARDVTICDLQIKAETDNAVLVENDRGDEAWIPFSQISKIDRYPSGIADVTMTVWIAEKKGLA